MMNICPSICENCINNNGNNWCEEYETLCGDCYEKCRKNGEVLSGNDIENQDDFEVWQRFCQ